MADQFKRGAFLDSFWDVSDLVPNSRSIKRKPKTIELEEIVADEGSRSHNQEDTVITRRIAPTPRESQVASFEKTEVYYPKNSLLHEIIIKKKANALKYYENFEQDALKYYNAEEKDAEYEPFFSYVPQYDQLNDKQRKYYFYF